MLHRQAAALVVLFAFLPYASIAQTAASPASSGNGITLVIIGQGLVSRAPDSATISTSIVTNDDIAANATAKNSAIFAALTAALAALHIDAADVKSIYYNVTFNPRPATPAPLPASGGAIAQSFPYPYPGPGARYGYVVNRQLTINLSQVNDAGAVIDAAVRAGVTGVTGVTYGLKDRAQANQAALALALTDAGNQAKVVAESTHLRLVGIKQIQIGQQYVGGPVPMPMRAIGPDAIPSVPTQITPSAIDVRATVTVTYNLKP
jgi:uncharacterized protein YggE